MDFLSVLTSLFSGRTLAGAPLLNFQFIKYPFCFQLDSPTILGCTVVHCSCEQFLWASGAVKTPFVHTVYTLLVLAHSCNVTYSTVALAALSMCWTLAWLLLFATACAAPWAVCGEFWLWALHAFLPQVSFLLVFWILYHIHNARALSTSLSLPWDWVTLLSKF